MYGLADTTYNLPLTTRFYAGPSTMCVAFPHQLLVKSRPSIPFHDPDVVTTKVFLYNCASSIVLYKHTPDISNHAWLLLLRPDVAQTKVGDMSSAQWLIILYLFQRHYNMYPYYVYCASGDLTLSPWAVAGVHLHHHFVPCDARLANPIGCSIYSARISQEGYSFSAYVLSLPSFTKTLYGLPIRFTASSLYFSLGTLYILLCISTRVTIHIMDYMYLHMIAVWYCIYAHYIRIYICIGRFYRIRIEHVLHALRLCVVCYTTNK